MTLTITEENKAAVDNAFRFSIALLTENIRKEASVSHPDRHGLDAWHWMEREIAHIKTLRALLDEMEAAEAEKKEEE